MKDLIAKLEAATAPDRELDVSVHLAAGRDVECEYTATRDVPRYTASLDAALTLVPEGYGGIVGIGKSGLTFLWQDGRGRDRGISTGSKPKTPAIALCIVALKVREALK